MEMTLRSDNELGFRVLLQRAAPAQWDAAMQSVSSNLGFAGTVINADLEQADPSGPVHIRYDYSRPDFADWANHRILPLFPYLEITTIAKDKAPDHDIDQGTPRTLEAITHIQLPDGYKADLPDAVHVKRDYATFDKTYRLENGKLTVERKLVIVKRKVPQSDWKDYYAYIKAVGMEDGESYISLYAATTSPEKPAPSNAKSDGSTTSESAQPAVPRSSPDGSKIALIGGLKQLAIPYVVPPGSPALLIRDAVLDCSALFPTCGFVLMPQSGLNQETLH